jgi:hypothetical protein
MAGRQSIRITEPLSASATHTAPVEQRAERRVRLDTGAKRPPTLSRRTPRSGGPAVPVPRDRCTHAARVLCR